MAVQTKKKSAIPVELSGVLGFLKEVHTELSKVVWPSRADTIKLTAIVVGASVFIAIYIGLLDLGFTKLIDILLLR